MDFIDPNKKRKHIQRLYVGYGLLAILLAMVTFFVVSLAYGYNFNVRTGEIRRDGLIFVDSRPGGSNLIVNGKLRGVTDARLVVSSGSYNIQINKAGYQPWHRTIILKGGTVERLVYPFLFPETLLLEDVDLYSEKPLLVTQSPDRKWLLVQQATAKRSFELFDLNQDLVLPIKLSLPDVALTLTGDQHSYEYIEWSNDNRHLILLHKFDGGQEFILVDTEDVDLSVNLSKTFAHPFTDLMLRDKKFNSYYLYDKSSKTLSTARLNSPKDITSILTNVLKVKPHGENELLYIMQGTKKDEVHAMTRFGGEDYEIRKFSSNDKYLLDIARYNGKWYMATGAASESKVYVYRDPVNSIRSSKDLLPASIMRLDDPRYISFSSNAQFIVVQSLGKFAVYDAENDLDYRYDTGLKVASGTKAQWMDGHRLTLTDKMDKTSAFDYNGINMYELFESYKEFKPFFSTDYSDVFFVGQSEGVSGTPALVRSSLEVK